MKKVLHVSYGGLDKGGVSSVILSIVRVLHNNFDFGGVVFHGKNSRENIFKQYGKVYCINSYGRRGIKRIFELLLRPFVMYCGIYRICKNEHYDIIHCHNGFDMVYCLLAAKHAGVKMRIAHSHNSASPVKFNFAKRIVNGIQRYFINTISTHRIGCSVVACEDLFGNNNYQVIFNSIDLSKFIWKRNEHQGFHVVHVGRYCFQKNQTFIIDVVNLLKNYISDLQVKLVGFGNDKEILERKIKFLQLDDIISLVDGREVDIHEVYSDADIMIFPSEYEGFGIALIEAQATGCYCFTSDVIPSDTNIGLMVQLSLKEPAQAWTEKIVTYWTSEYRVQYEQVKSRIALFDEKVIARQYQELYGEE